MRRACSRRDVAAFTLIELMVVVVVVGIILTLAAPSFFDFLLAQRLRGVQAQVVTDLQYARSEAVSRNTVMRVSLRSNGTLTCYSIYTSQLNSLRCDCRLGAGNACTGLGGTAEIKTEQVLRSRRVTVLPSEGEVEAFGFDPVTGGLISIPSDFPSQPLNRVVVAASADAARTYHTVANRAGRVTVCAPTGSTMPVPSC